MSETPESPWSNLGPLSEAGDAPEGSAQTRESSIAAGLLPTVTTLPVDDGPEEVPAPAKKKPLGVGAWLAIAWLVIVVLCGILSPFFVKPTVNLTDPSFARSAPTWSHPFGGDGNGIDVFQQVIRGTTTSLLVSVGAVVLGLVVGGLLGLISGFFGGKVDLIMSNSFSILLAFPQLVLALALVSALAGEPTASSNKRIAVLILGLGIVAIPLLARITRANTLVWAEREFVMAARAMGAKRWRILFKDVLPNVLPAMVSISLLGIAIAIVAEGGLAILGVGVKDTPSWGNIIALQRGNLTYQPWVVFGPVLAIFLTVMALNFLGDVIGRRFNVKEAQL